MKLGKDISNSKPSFIISQEVNKIGKNYRNILLQDGLWLLPFKALFNWQRLALRIQHYTGQEESNESTLKKIKTKSIRPKRYLTQSSLRFCRLTFFD